MIIFFKDLQLFTAYVSRVCTLSGTDNSVICAPSRDSTPTFSKDNGRCMLLIFAPLYALVYNIVTPSLTNTCLGPRNPSPVSSTIVSPKAYSVPPLSIPFISSLKFCGLIFSLVPFFSRIASATSVRKSVRLFSLLILQCLELLLLRLLWRCQRKTWKPCSQVPSLAPWSLGHLCYHLPLATQPNQYC